MACNLLAFDLVVTDKSNNQGKHFIKNGTLIIFFAVIFSRFKMGMFVVLDFFFTASACSKIFRQIFSALTIVFNSCALAYVCNHLIFAQKFCSSSSFVRFRLFFLLLLQMFLFLLKFLDAIVCASQA